ncbi:MAG: DUF2079 domain-containing protein [Patescibacteria group bacterium]
MRTRIALSFLGLIGLAVLCWTLLLANAKLHAGVTNALDLGIYTQVAWLSGHGHIFGFTIHPHLYLGDHVEFLFVLAALPFRLFPWPLTLVALQGLAVVGAAFALYTFCLRVGLATKSSLVWASIFLLNPFTLNALVFEFHALLFALPFVFLAAIAYQKKTYNTFWLWLIVVLLAREDASIFVASFAVLGLLERRSLRWWLWPGIVAVLWFFGTSLLAGAINGEGYKFLSLLSGESSAGGSLRNILLVFNLGNVLVLIALLIGMVGLPLLAWRWAVTLLVPFFALGLAGLQGGDLILQTHYAVFFLPMLFCSAVLGWHSFTSRPPSWAHTLGEHLRPLSWITLGVVSVYGLLTFGPTIGAIQAWRAITPAQQAKGAAMQSLRNATAPSASVLAGYGTLPLFSARANIYASHYAFLGKRQYSDQDYPLPSKLDLAVLDAEDFVTYQVQFAKKPSRATDYLTGVKRFTDLLAAHQLRLTSIDDTLLTFTTQGTDLFPQVVTQRTREPLSGVEFLIQTPAPAIQIADGKTTLPIIAQVGNPSLANLQLELRWFNASHQLLETRYLPLGYGLYPTSAWKNTDEITTNFTLVVPDEAASGELRAIIPSGHLALNGWRAAEVKLDKDTQQIGLPVTVEVER